MYSAGCRNTGTSGYRLFTQMRQSPPACRPPRRCRRPTRRMVECEVERLGGVSHVDVLPPQIEIMKVLIELFP